MPPPMMLQPQRQPPPVTKNSRIDLDELKSQIVNRLGQERSNRYFSHLNGFLAQKLSKPEFNKFCILTFGHENLPLHNQFILAIFRNACQAKAPPQVDHGKFAQRPTGFVSKKPPQVDKGLDSSKASKLVPQTWSNGDILPQSPCKFRSGVNNYRINDWSNHIEPSNETILGEDHELYSSDFKRSMEQKQDESYEQPTKRARREGASLHDQNYAHSKPFGEITFLECMDNVDYRGELDSFGGPIQAPLGIPSYSASTGGAKKTLLSASIEAGDSFSRSSDCGELCNTLELKKLMEKMVEAHGLGGVTVDCANLLNKGLDAYLKRLIRSCVELRGGGVSRKQTNPSVKAYASPINGIHTINNIQRQGSAGSLRATHVSMKDFATAMELNPQQLGEKWPLLLEKISFHSYEE